MKIRIIDRDKNEIVNEMTESCWINSLDDESSRRVNDGEMTIEESVERWNSEQCSKYKTSYPPFFAEIFGENNEDEYRYWINFAMERDEFNELGVDAESICAVSERETNDFVAYLQYKKMTSQKLTFDEFLETGKQIMRYKERDAIEFFKNKQKQKV